MSMSVGNPIHIGMGEKYQSENDYNGTDSLDFTRYYHSSLFAPKGSFGLWRDTFDRKISTLNSGSFSYAYITRANGKQFSYQLIGNLWVTEADIKDTLVRLTDASGNVSGWQFSNDSNNQLETYNDAGRLISIKDRSNLTQTLTYSCSPVSATCPVATPTTVAPYADSLIKVTDNFGKALNFTYNTAGQMATMTDPASNVFRYAYDAAGNVASVTYPDDTPTVLTDNPVRAYVYGELANTTNVSQPNALTGIIEKANAADVGVRYATYQYDASGKAISTEHAGSVEKYSLAYAPDGTSTAVTDPLGSVRTTHFTTILGVVKPTGTDQPGGSGCSAASSALTYDANGNIASKTDFNGHKTCYAYDLARNLETARVEGLPSVADCAANLSATNLPAPARKATTSWHPSYRLPVQVAEPKLLATHTYDPSGNLLTRTEQATTDLTGTAGLTPTVSGTARTWTYTYNNFGQVLTADGPRTDVADVTTYTYYPVTDATIGNRGNLATAKNALGQTTTYNSYDGNGRPTKITAPNGVVTTLAYYPRGWLKALTVTGGTNIETTQYLYFPTGLLQKVTQPDLSVLTYGYDAAHRLTSVTDSLGNKVTYTLDNMGNRTGEQATDPTNVLRRNITRAYDALNRLQTVTGAEQ